MIHSEYSKMGGAEYSAPACECVGLDTNSTICLGSAGEFGIDPWEDENLGLDF